MYSGPLPLPGPFTSIFDSQDQKLSLRDTASKAYDYDIFNKLTSVAGTSAQSGNMLNVTYAYDAKGRLLEENDAEIGTITRFAYSGTQLISEFNTNNTVLRRYVHGPGVDEPIVVYEGSGTVNKSWMMADHQGSIIGYTNGNGAVTNINTYSMEGVPGDNNVGRFGYTGQMWLEGAELYHYKARAYDPQLGRFLQADPIGYGDGLNMYAYVGGDALNSRDPSGLNSCGPNPDECVVTGKKRRTVGFRDIFGRGSTTAPRPNFGNIFGGISLGHFINEIKIKVERAICQHSVNKFVSYLNSVVGTRGFFDDFQPVRIANSLGEISPAILNYVHPISIGGGNSMLGARQTFAGTNSAYANAVSQAGYHSFNLRLPGSPGGYHVAQDVGKDGVFVHYDAANPSNGIVDLIRHGIEANNPFIKELDPIDAAQSFGEFCER